MATVRRLGLFPSCVTDFTGWSQDAAVAAFWRVKNWRIASSSGEYGDNLPLEGLKLYNGATASTSTEFETIIPSLNERNLICSNGLEWKNRFVLSEQEYQGEPFLFYEVITVGMHFYDKTAVLYMNLTVKEIGGDTSQVSYGTQIGTCSFNFKDHASNMLSVQFPMYYRYEGSEITLNLTFEVGDYWPYDPGDGGGPIYSSTTGDRLRESPAN